MTGGGFTAAAANTAFREKIYLNSNDLRRYVRVLFTVTGGSGTGAVYAPYIPLIMTPLVYDPKNFQPRKGVMTRYAKEMIRGEFYGKVFVDGLNTLGSTI